MAYQAKELRQPLKSFFNQINPFMYRVITLGGATYDVFLQSEAFREVSDPHFKGDSDFPGGVAECFALGGKIALDEIIKTTGGGGTNAAVTFARQGLKTAAIYKVGRDVFGGEIINELTTENVKSFANIDPKEPTGYSTILLSPTGERTVLVYRGAGGKLSPAEIPLEKLRCDWLYVTPGDIPLKVLEKVLDYADRKEIFVAVNPSGFYIEQGIKTLAELFKNIKVLILNQDEAAELTNLPNEASRPILDKLCEYFKCMVVMTNGKHGALVKAEDKLYEVGTFKEKAIVDRTGAGDAFGSGFVAGLIEKHGKDIEYAIRLASANATSVVEVIGAKPGILTNRAFENSPRFKKLSIKKSNY